MEKMKTLDYRDQLEKSITFTCQEVPNITYEMFVEANILRLGQIIVDLKKENEELQEHIVPRTLSKLVVRCKERLKTQLE